MIMIKLSALSLSTGLNLKLTAHILSETRSFNTSFRIDWHDELSLTVSRQRYSRDIFSEAEAEGGMALGWTILLGVTILVLTLLYWIIQQRRDQPPPGIKQLPAFPGICWPLIGQLPTVMQWPSNGQHHAIEKVINETKESSLLLRVPGITAVLTVDPGMTTFISPFPSSSHLQAHRP